MKVNGEHINVSYQFQRYLFIIGFILIIPTIYFLLFPSYLSSVPRPIHHKLRNKSTEVNVTSKDESKQWYKVRSPQNIPDDEEIDMVSKSYPNIPLKFWKSVENILGDLHLSNASCAPFPDIFKLDIHNTYWQTIHMSNKTSVQIYSAYYDNREISGQVVRILSMVNKTSINFPGNQTLYCQLWFEGEKEPVIAPMDKPEYMWFEYWHSHQDGTYGPFLLGCSIPQSHQDKIPQVVSLVDEPCDKASNMLRVVYELPDKKREFTVCVKGLDFLQIDLSLRLVEWIELVLHLGAEKIFMYQLEVHPNVQKVLDYYTKQGKLDVRPITLPSGHPTLLYLQHVYLIRNNFHQCLDEIIPYNDCFYRNLYSHDYVALFDIDEIILPLKDSNWHDLLARTKSYDKTEMKYNSFTARHIYYLDKMQTEGPYEDIPPYMHMMQHVFRAQNFTNPGDYVKTFFNTNNTISCHNHWPISTAPNTASREFHLDEARMQHYRQTCSWEVNCTKFLTNPVKDTRMWDFKDILIPRVNEALKNIGLIG